MRTILWAMTLCLFSIAASLGEDVAPVEIINNHVIQNPGNGFFRLRTNVQQGFDTITIVDADPNATIGGKLTFKSGTYEAVLDLSTDRFLKLAGRVPHVDVLIEGVMPTALFNIVLL